ncbi:hypothetical protein CENSYa_1291 [Cenarchaeum symbiosum A]|uniref:DUF393 domain-containing protein n=1 Tax=Cenarchaeum symbiosum (strain A) TaxID=414004 RepID=A0RX47_CENSY|nr:hypothetical protein CENSYa_1291 [Cenarchaeum symbiosum A]
MDAQKLAGLAPLVIYDDRCSACTRFARAVGFLARGRFLLVGHYSQMGGEMRALLEPGARDVFWFIDGRTAFGGRPALLPMLRALVLGRGRRRGGEAAGECSSECGASAVLLRSASLLKKGKIVELLPS